MGKTMIVHTKAAVPERQPDGSWHVVLKEFDEEIPDKGRHTAVCNECLEDSYPGCMEWCPFEADARKRGLR